MTSILTNSSALAALSTLRSISSSMEETQGRISSGLRVGEASDNAAYWSIATTMRSDNGALSAVQDAIGLGGAKIDTAYAGMNSAIDVVKSIKEKLVAAREPGVDKAKIQEELDQLQEQLSSISQSASFSGENWLQGDATGAAVTKSVVGSFVRDSTGGVSIKTIDYLLDKDALLFDTNTNVKGTTNAKGILDGAFNISTGNRIKLDVNSGGTVSQKEVKAYSANDLLVSGAIFQGDNIARVTTANTNGADATGYYVKVANDTWVQAASHAASTYFGQEAAASHTTTNTNFNTVASAFYSVNTNAAASTTTITFSVTSLDITSAGFSIDNALSVVENALGKMTSAAATLGAASSRLDLQEEFVNELRDAITEGVGRLVDADMNEESTRLKALQTQQQLAIQALSIANSDSQSVLSLFR